MKQNESRELKRNFTDEVMDIMEENRERLNGFFDYEVQIERVKGAVAISPMENEWIEVSVTVKKNYDILDKVEEYEDTVAKRLEKIEKKKEKLAKLEKKIKG